MKNPYEILGVAQSSSQDEIKKVYRRLAKKYHPDVNKGDKKAEEKFKDISQAYDVLGDPEKRKKYDQLGQWADQGNFDPRHQAYKTWNWTSGPPEGGGQADFDLGDLFGDIFGMAGGMKGGMGGSPGRRGGGRGRREEPEGQDLQASVDISFEEAIRGTPRRISLVRDGREEKIDVKIPAGIKDGGKIRLAGKGEKGGDLYIKVNVSPHPRFWREDDDLYIEVPITVTEAVLGAKVRVPTLDGAVNLNIPAGTSSGQRFRLPGKGAPRLGKSDPGDQYILVKIVVPPHLDEKMRELFQEIDKKVGYNPRE